MTRRIESRLAKLETTRRESEAVARDPNRPKHISELLGGPYDATITLPRIFAEMERRMAEEIAAGTYKPPEPPDPTIWPQNVINVDSEFLKITGDIEGWRENEKKIKRWSTEWEQENWPNVEREAE